MTGLPLIIAFIIAIVVMIVAISKFKIHPFLSIMGVSLILGLVAGIPLVDQTGNGRNRYQWVSDRDWSWIFRYIYQHRYCDHSWSTDRKYSGRNRCSTEACRYGHSSGWKKSPGIGYGADGMGCFHSCIL